MAEMQPPSQPVPPMRPHRGVMVLVFGILGLFPWCCLVITLGILAIVFGSMDLKAMTQGRMDPSGKRLTQAGLILGIVSVVEQIAVFAYGVHRAIPIFQQMMQSGQFSR